MCLGQPSRVPGGSILAVREMAAMFPIIRRPYGCLLNYGSCRSLPWRFVGVGVPALVGLLGLVLVAPPP